MSNLRDKLGVLHPHEYDWREQAEAMPIGLLTADTGKVYGLAMALDEAFDLIRRVQGDLSLIASERGDCVEQSNEMYEFLTRFDEYHGPNFTACQFVLGDDRPCGQRIQFSAILNQWHHVKNTRRGNGHRGMPNG